MESCVVVGVGASAGGLEAFNEFLNFLSDKTGMAFVLIQHLDPGHESHLTEILARVTSMPVVTITDGMIPLSNHVYVMPPNVFITVEKNELKVWLRPKERRPQKPIDAFFLSL